jgi:hypothetical protein
MISFLLNKLGTAAAATNGIQLAGDDLVIMRLFSITSKFAATLLSTSDS